MHASRIHEPYVIIWRLGVCIIADWQSKTGIVFDPHDNAIRSVREAVVQHTPSSK
jgi:hypothetical protein